VAQLRDDSERRAWCRRLEPSTRSRPDAHRLVLNASKTKRRPQAIRNFHHERPRRELAFRSVHLPSALLARPRFFNDCSEKDTARLLMSRPVALICSAISAAERAPCWPRPSAIAEPVVWRASAWLLASGVRFGFGPGPGLVFREGSFSSARMRNHLAPQKCRGGASQQQN
jgi:hypothetical protein